MILNPGEELIVNGVKGGASLSVIFAITPAFARLEKDGSNTTVGIGDALSLENKGFFVRGNVENIVTPFIPTKKLFAWPNEVVEPAPAPVPSTRKTPPIYTIVAIIIVVILIILFLGLRHC